MSSPLDSGPDPFTTRLATVAWWCTTLAAVLYFLIRPEDWVFAGLIYVVGEALHYLLTGRNWWAEW